MAGIGPRDPNMLGLDGVTYQFQVGRQSCGSTWSPSSETIPGKLVSLVEQLKMLDRSRVEPDASLREREILATAAEILGEFGRRSQAPLHSRLLTTATCRLLRRSGCGKVATS